MTHNDERRASFEDTYPKYPFSELMRLALEVTSLICRQLEAIDEHQSAKHLRKRRNQAHSGRGLG